MIYSYRRVSKEEQVNGPQAQADAITKWRHNNCPDTPYQDFFDNGVSGSVPLCDRPQGGAMLLKSGDVVVVSKLDRLFRSVADAAGMIHLWNKLNITIVAIAEQFDMTTPMGRAMAQMASVFAELEREMIRSRTKDALDAKRSRGECVGEPPYGWDRVGDMMVENTAEQFVIGKILEYAKTQPAAAIAVLLNAGNVTAKKGGIWHKTQVRRVIERAALMAKQPCP